MNGIWKEIAFGFGGLWLTIVSWVVGREVKRLDGKADRSEVDGKADRSEVLRLINLMEKRDEEAKEDRGKMYKKLDAIKDDLNDFKVEVARYMGSQNGK